MQDDAGQPQWEARYSPDVGWYVRLGEDVEATWYPEHAGKARELAEYLNVQQQRIQQAETSRDSALRHEREMDGELKHYLRRNSELLEQVATLRLER